METTGISSTSNHSHMATTSVHCNLLASMEKNILAMDGVMWNDLAKMSGWERNGKTRNGWSNCRRDSMQRYATPWVASRTIEITVDYHAMKQVGSMSNQSWSMTTSGEISIHWLERPAWITQFLLRGGTISREWSSLSTSKRKESELKC